MCPSTDPLSPPSSFSSQLWDIAGQDRFGAIYRVYYKDAFGALLVFDLSRPETFTSVLKWKRELDSKVTLPNGSPLPVLLLANKCDLPESTVDKAQLDAFCTEHGFIGWIDTSAKTNHNVEEAVKRLVGDVLTHTEAFEAQKSAAAVAAAVPGQVKLAGLSPEPAAKKGCC